VYLCAKPTLRSARHDSGTRFFLIPGLRRHPLPTDGGGDTHSHDFFVDTPHSRRYLAYLRHATKLDRVGASAASTWRLPEGDRCSGRWYELLVNNIRWELVLNHCRAMLLAPGPPLAPRLASERWPSYLSSSTGCTLQQFGAWSSCHGSYPAPLLALTQP
jgi:hypothetical protein